MKDPRLSDPLRMALELIVEIAFVDDPNEFQQALDGQARTDLSKELEHCGLSIEDAIEIYVAELESSREGNGSV